MRPPPTSIGKAANQSRWRRDSASPSGMAHNTYQKRPHRSRLRARVSERDGALSAAAQGRLRVRANSSTHWLASGWVEFSLASIGITLNIGAYGSLLPVALSALLVAVSLLILAAPTCGGKEERDAFLRLFLVGFVMSGVAAIYASSFEDPTQLSLDAAHFFDLASRPATEIQLSFGDLLDQENGLAAAAWAAFYEAMAVLGFPRERYVGILLNVAAVGMTGVIAVKATRRVFGDDPDRIRRLILLMSSCGLWWLFAGIHLRDAFVLLGVTALFHSWTCFLDKPSFGMRFLGVCVTSAAGAAVLGSLRTEFVFVPIAMALTGTASLMAGRVKSALRVRVYALVVIGFGLSVALSVYQGQDFLSALVRGNEGYSEISIKESATDSLGMAIIVDQPMPVRLLLGSGYMLVAPIPFWSGFQFERVYDLFKSASALFFYFVIPLLVMGASRILTSSNERTPPLLFAFLLTVCVIVATAGTSLESRHLGAFLVPMFILAILSDTNLPAVRRTYRRLLVVTLSGMAIVHVAWAVLKMK